MTEKNRHGGDVIASVLASWKVPALFTLCGGHISPILVGARDQGIRIIDCRDERSAVFAADAASRLTGIPGVAAVTAGPGVTNAITALKNAQLAQTPLVLFGGATATVLRGRGALQDIDQLALLRPAVKWAASCSTVGQLAPVVERAFRHATHGVPGPVFVEVPVDVLYPEEIVSEWYMKESGAAQGDTLAKKALGLYLRGRLYRQFRVPHVQIGGALPRVVPKENDHRPIARAAAAIAKAERPALVVGNQTMVGCKDPEPLARAVASLGMPVWLGGAARGLLGPTHPIQFRHKRSAALKEADLVVTCGFPFDFRLKYGLGLNPDATVIAANLSSVELKKNRRPQIAAQMEAADFLIQLADEVSTHGRWAGWIAACRQRETERDEAIHAQANPGGELVDPIYLFERLEKKLADDSVLVVDGGDFAATGAYILRPRGPLSWLDPGVFGTLGVGGGFAVGAAALRPDAEVWVIYGDGASAYSLAEFDTCVRHGLAPIAVIGTDASWQQIARDQVTILGTDLGTTLRKTDYHTVAEGYGAVGLLLDNPQRVDEVIDQAKEIARSGRPVCINVHIAKSDFRSGSISI